MRKLKRVLSIVTMSAMLIGTLPVLAAPAVQEEETPIYYISESYTEDWFEPKTASGFWNNAAPYNLYYTDVPGSSVCKQGYSPWGPNHWTTVMSFSNSTQTKVYRWLDDNGAIYDNSIDYYVYEWSMKIMDTSEGWSIHPFLTVEGNQSGLISGSENSYGRFPASGNEIDYWHTVTVEVNKQAQTYDMYFDSVRIKTNVPFPEAASSQRLSFQNHTMEHSGPSTMKINSFVAYSGRYTQGQVLPEVDNPTWFNSEFWQLTQSQLAAIPTTGFFGSGNEYQNFYVERRYAQDATIDSNSAGLVLDVPNGYISPLILYRFAEDNLCPGAINTGGIFTYEMRINPLGSSWDIGFLQRNSYKAILATLNIANGDYSGKPNIYFSGTWCNLALEVDQGAGRFKVYLDGELKIDRFMDLQDLNAFMIKNDFGYGTLTLSNLRAYPGQYRNPF